MDATVKFEHVNDYAKQAARDAAEGTYQTTAVVGAVLALALEVARLREVLENSA